MKKEIYHLLVWLGIAAACTPNFNDRVFEKTINERVAAQRQEYTQALTAPQHGWISQYALKGEKGVTGAFTVLFKFFAHDSVRIYSDHLQGIPDATTRYRLDQGWKMELVFESRSALHTIAEIEKFQLGREFVFTFGGLMGDKILLLSRANPMQRKGQQRLLLSPAQAQDWNLKPHYLHEAKLSKARQLMLNRQRSATLGFDKVKRILTINSVIDGGQTQAPVVFTRLGFQLIQPLIIGNVTMAEFVFESNIFHESKNKVLTIQ